MNKDKINILLVEDREEDAELTMMALRKDKFNGQVYWTKDGDEAINFLLEQPDPEIIKNLRLILLDVNIPKLNGLEVLKRIKNSHLRGIPVVMLTTSNHEKDVTTAYDNYVNSYLLKPVRFDQFQLFIERVRYYWTDLNVAHF
ncbi:response regulator [Marinoscillum sp. MHG1-6]|uniref:response regulator n=1 Tax=Marinoscillum sp. MHG1-6 TaxID=2959627 RepID=UPI00215824D3|nr:response regulator [Marinoscillum sp. MHG1-6]